MQATVFDTQPVLAYVEKAAQRRSSGTFRSGIEFSKALADVMVTQVEALADRPETLGDAKFVKDLTELFQSTFSCIGGIVRTSELDDKAADRFFDNLKSFSQRHCSCEERTTAGEGMSQLGKAIHQACAILYNLVCNQNQFGHISHESYSDGLLTALQSVQDATFKRAPYVRLWM